ncbi:sensor histidine kinase KdpD [Porphyromonas sp.]|uniref:sensor histidine kinase n=1 Tax=Porphyromonas sp. TaxID=1924944 RepID=UPI0026DB2960|nr:HAMP domain-containing sensor histidine kinase [Porphyromonas sp.]MDO4695445.1 HAMP domain-containing sensor histidine kinase [Porphyromonas sp.]MDO4771240.1 HAMP domain-containing sensor histidine kinase [Porphyromonas sp.]
MRRSTIWLLITVMLFAFAGLLYMQVSYINVMFRYRNEQFNESVRGALFQVNRALEKDEMRKWLDNELLKPHAVTPNSFGSPLDLSLDPKRYQLDQLPIDPLRPITESNDKILDTSKLLQSQLSSKLGYIQETLSEYAIDMLMKESSTPFYDRVSQRQLETYIGVFLSDAKISLYYVYEVVDYSNQIYYSNGRVPTDEPAAVYTQALFPNNKPSDLHFLRVYFPGKKDYISGSIGFLMPSIIFTTGVFILSILTIILILRQKKLAELRSDFINNMTHELKTPVSTIILGSQMLKDKDVNKTPEMAGHILDSIADEGKRLNFLIEKVLHMSLFDKEKVAFKFKEIDIQDLLISVVSTFSIKTESYGGGIEIDLDATKTDVYVDEMHITNVLFNLLDNAIKYRRPDVPPQLVVGTYNEGNNLCICIQDNGIGIKKEYLKKVFDRFFRVPTGNVHDVKGFGLGLAYVNKIVKNHGGSIRAESQLGKGTKFIIILPLINTK